MVEMEGRPGGDESNDEGVAEESRAGWLNE